MANAARGVGQREIRGHRLLRYDSPQQIAFRHALEDFEFGDAAMRKGQTVGFGLGSANRDPRVFPDADTLDLAREDAASGVRRRHPHLRRQQPRVA